MKSHLVCVPAQAQSHLGGMLKLAKILHHRGFFITFINTEFNHRRLLRFGGLTSLEGLPDWRFFSIPDGIHWSDTEATLDKATIIDSCRNYMVNPLCDLIGKLNEEVRWENGSDVPPISHIVADSFMDFAAAPAAEKFSSAGASVHDTSLCDYGLEALSLVHRKMPYAVER